MKRFSVGWAIAGGLIFGFLATSSQAEVPRRLAFQGRLTNAQGQPLNGNQTLIFRLFDAPAGGARLWEETQTLSVTSSLFSTSLGNTAALQIPFDRPYWVEIQVGAEILSPRQPLTSSPYALRAQALDGIQTFVSGAESRLRVESPSGNAVLDLHNPGNQVYELRADRGINRLVIARPGAAGNMMAFDPNNGNVGIGTVVPGEKLHLNGGGGNGYLKLDYTQGSQTGIQWAQNGASHWWMFMNTGRDDLRIHNPTSGDMVTFQKNGNVGIGTTAPGAKLDVAGAIHISGGGTDSWFPYTDGNTYIRGSLIVQKRPPAYSSLFSVLENGNVGIGIADPGGYRLYVNGPAYATGGWQGSSIQLKTDIHRLSAKEEQALLAKLTQVSLYRYRLKEPDGLKSTHLGVLAEESPRELVDDKQKAISYSDYLAALLAGLKTQQAQLQAQQEQIKELQRVIKRLQGGSTS